MPVSNQRRGVAAGRSRNARERNVADERLLRSIVDSVVDGIVAVDADGYVRFANPAAVRLMDIPVEQIVGEPFRYPQRAGAISEVSVLHNNGSAYTLEFCTAEVDVDGASLLVTDIRDITDRMRLRTELEALSRSDELTGLYNRRGFLSMCERYLRLADRSNWSVLVLFLDLDGLKEINDVYGHAAGDQSLMLVATALCSTMRTTDILARVGGDEFAVASLNVAAGDVATLRERVDHALRTMCTAYDTPFQARVSIGAARYDPHCGRPVADLLADADADMYAQKLQGTANEAPTILSDESPAKR